MEKIADIAAKRSGYFHMESNGLPVNNTFNLKVLLRFEVVQDG